MPPGKICQFCTKLFYMCTVLQVFCRHFYLFIIGSVAEKLKRKLEDTPQKPILDPILDVEGTPRTLGRLRRDNESNEVFHSVGGVTPDKKNLPHRFKMNMDVFDVLVHKEAALQNIDIKMWSPPLSFWKLMVDKYGYSGYCMLPTDSYYYLCKVWRDQFCESISTKSGPHKECQNCLIYVPSKPREWESNKYKRLKPSKSKKSLGPNINQVK